MDQYVRVKVPGQWSCVYRFPPEMSNGLGECSVSVEDPSESWLSSLYLSRSAWQGLWGTKRRSELTNTGVTVFQNCSAVWQFPEQNFAGIAYFLGTLFPPVSSLCVVLCDCLLVTIWQNRFCPMKCLNFRIVCNCLKYCNSDLQLTKEKLALHCPCPEVGILCTCCIMAMRYCTMALWWHSNRTGVFFSKHLNVHNNSETVYTTTWIPWSTLD